MKLFDRAKAFRDKGGVRPWLYLPLAFSSYALLDFVLRYVYKDFGAWRFLHPAPTLGTLGWCLILTGISSLLPGKVKKVYLGTSILLFALLTVTHGVLRNMFRRFFMFSTLAFAGDGAAFADQSYIVIHPAITMGVGLSVLIMCTAILLAPGRGEGSTLQTLGMGLFGILAGVGTIFIVHVHWLTPVHTLAWDNYTNPASVYESFTDSTGALLISGLYQYTFRDAALTLRMNNGIGPFEAQDLKDYVEERKATQKDNEMTGVFKGKNLIMIQLEAIDTWMLSPEYMPELSKVKEDSLVFTKHYTPAYITAGTFNTEFMANTGLIPATGTVSPNVYERNHYPLSIANQFIKAGYTAQSFHGSEGSVYNRGVIHRNLGYESYNSGSDMEMENYTLDHFMMAGYDSIVRENPFYSFLITYSGHGPYSAENPIYQAHKEKAQAIAKSHEGNYPYAVGHAMETDAFIKELMDRLEQDGALDNTVLVFYADHYNYYMMNDAQNMEIKGVSNLNLLQHTDFFIYSKDQKPQEIEKVTSSLDILPTLANLFGLADEEAVYMGNDAFSDEGGYAFFSDRSFVDGEGYWDRDKAVTEQSARRSEEIANAFLMSNLILQSDYYKP